MSTRKLSVANEGDFLKPRKIQLIRQPNLSSGCGPACVAMVAGVSFDDAVMAIWGYPLHRGLYCEHADVKQALMILGCAAAPRFVRSTSFAHADEMSIYLCRLQSKDPIHYVLWDPFGFRLYDPAHPKRIRHPIPELDRRYRPYSRLEVWPKP